MAIITPSLIIRPDCSARHNEEVNVWRAERQLGHNFDASRVPSKLRILTSNGVTRWQPFLCTMGQPEQSEFVWDALKQSDPAIIQWWYPMQTVVHPKVILSFGDSLTVTLTGPTID